MAGATSLQTPFLSDSHRNLSTELDAWIAREIAPLPHSEADVDAACRDLVRRLGDGGWLRYAVPLKFGGVHENLDLRSLCLIRERLAREWSLADFVFAMQGLGTAPVSLYGSDAQKRQYLPRVAAGTAIAAFALSEAEAGSDVSAMRTTARRAANEYVINGEKAWTSNAGIADHYAVFCRFPEQGEKGFLALMVDADNPGLRITKRTQVMAPHPLGNVSFEDCHVRQSAVIGAPGKGLSVALGTLDLFRTTVGAAAVGLARRALEEAITYVKARHAFGQPLSKFQLTQARIADMATAVDASTLLVHRAAWTHDNGSSRITAEAAMAKLYATESAQCVIDSAVQLLGGQGVVSGTPVERLYREIRALRIYEGTSEIQKLVIANQLLSSPPAERSQP
jgi:acyl-CoA dehydrogenase